MKIDRQIEQRLITEHNIWLATVRSDGRPHLVPVWFVWLDQKIYICTEAKSLKARNILANPNVSASLEDGNKPLVLEGLAKSIGKADQSLIAAFQSKYEWDITTDMQYKQVIEIEVKKIRA